MKIALKSDPEKIYVVYGVYWTTSREKFQRHHFIIEHEDELAGFSVVLESEVDIIDASLMHFVIDKDDYGMDMLIHKATVTPEYLFGELINHNDFDNIEILLSNMRKLNLEV